MKFQNKLQFFFLFTALAVFTGQEIIHPLFHRHHEVNSAHSQYQAGKPEEFKKTNKSTKDVSFEAACPICSSTTHKSTQAPGIQAELISCKAPDYSQLCQSFSFTSYTKPVSRGPPAV
jgi:hypothetical protein